VSHSVTFGQNKCSKSKPIELLCKVIFVLSDWGIGSMPGCAFTQTVSLYLHHLVVLLAFNTAHSCQLFPLFLLHSPTNPQTFILFCHSQHKIILYRLSYFLIDLI
jgi:hypothetical protein